jgi:diacylglycerol O-acyltransferase-1
MSVQIFLISLTKNLKDKNSPISVYIGNAIFWLSFVIIGQPFATLFCFIRWEMQFGTASRQANLA